MDEREERIISLIRIKGPVVPSQISSDIGLEPLFTSAILSELATKKRLAISNLKIGSSPLYYLPEQKSYLENHLKGLNHREREAFELLKEKQVVEDTKLEPVMRVAIREIKDFAVPMKVTQNNQDKIFWRFYSLSNEEAIPPIREILKRSIPEVRKATPIEPEKEVTKIEPEKQITEPVKEPIKKKVRKPRKKTEKQIQEEQEIKKFIEKIHIFTENNRVEIIAEIKIRKKDETHMIVSLDSALGKIDYLLIAKKKQSISSKDLTDAYKKGKTAKMPVLFLTDGELTAAAEKYEKSLKSHLIARKLIP